MRHKEGKMFIFYMVISLTFSSVHNLCRIRSSLFYTAGRMTSAMAVIAVFSGTTRSGKKGQFVAQWIARILEQRGHTVHMIDPTEYEELLVLHIPNHYNPKPTKQMQAISKMLCDSDGFILVSPEYNHSFSGALKNAIDNFMPEYEKKPFGIATYSAGPFGGIRANEALRPVVSELKGVPTPLPFLVSHVQNLFNDAGELQDNRYSDRLAIFLDDFEWYVNALKAARGTHTPAAAHEKKRAET
jgi:NAD(P)H-dependent FMN reductase